MNKKKVWNTVLCILFGLAIVTCVIVNIALDGLLSWSLIAVGGCVISYLCCVILIFGGKNRLIKAFAMISIFVIPYLFLIETVINSVEPIPYYWAMSFGVPTSILWLAALWIMIIIKKTTHANIWIMIGIGVLLFYAAERVTNRLVDKLAGSSDSWRLSEEFPIVYFMTAGAFLIIGVGAAFIKYRMSKRTN